MARKALDNHRDDIINKNRSGRTIADIAREYGVTHKVIDRILGPDAILERDIIDSKLAGCIDAFRGGESVNSISMRTGIGRPTVNRYLRRHGVEPRGQSDAERIKWAKRSPQERREFLRRNHEALRGRKRSLSERIKMAKTRQERVTHTSAAELELADMLAVRGHDCIPQFAIGPYNCDLATGSVAVELWGGQWHFYGTHAANTPKRFRYILDAGYSIIVVMNTATDPLTPAVADYISNLIDVLRSDPSGTREYRVIWGAGKHTLTGRGDPNEFPLVPPFTHAIDPVTGNYMTVPR